jgi:ribosomal protein S18 acetylase RimI-like enzyme
MIRITDEDVYDSHHGEAFARVHALDGDSVVGYVTYSIFMRLAHIQHIFVDPAYRRQGIARKMLDVLYREYGYGRIKPGGLTPDGVKLLESIQREMRPGWNAARLERRKKKAATRNPPDRKLAYVIDENKADGFDVIAKHVDGNSPTARRLAKTVGWISLFEDATDEGVPVFSVSSLTVKDEFRGKGVALRLYVEAAKYARRNGNVAIASVPAERSHDANDLHKALPKYLNVRSARLRSKFHPMDNKCELYTLKRSKS